MIRAAHCLSEGCFSTIKSPKINVMLQQLVPMPQGLGSSRKSEHKIVFETTTVTCQLVPKWRIPKQTTPSPCTPIQKNPSNLRAESALSLNPNLTKLWLLWELQQPLCSLHPPPKWTINRAQKALHAALSIHWQKWIITTWTVTSKLY